MVRSIGESFTSEIVVEELTEWWCAHYPLPFHFLIRYASQITPKDSDRLAWRRVATALIVGLQGLKPHLVAHCTDENFYCLEEAAAVTAPLPPGKRDAILRGMLSPADLQKFDRASDFIMILTEREEVRNTIAFLAGIIRGALN